MKKRLTSVLLTICMVASLFSAMGVTASADGVETIEYTLKSGDTVYKVCQKLGIDFYANYDWITSTNNIKNYSSLGVGKKIILPLSNTAGVTGGTTTGSTTTAAPGTANLQLITGDTISSYLIPYVVSSGDTLYDICLGKGINYNANLDTILKINGLKNANRIAVGRTLLLPSATAPASGACVAVVAHKVVSGDATYNLCKTYGIDYNDNLALMMALNGKSNMAVIKTGQTLLIPVPTTVVANSGTTGGANNGGANVGTNNGNTGNTGNTGNSGSTNNGGNTTTTVSYKINKNNTNVNHGSYTVLVNNTNASTAVKGDTVTVNATAKMGYALDYVKVVDKNGKSVSVNGTTFTMPESDVTIDVVFVSSKQYKITSDYASNGSYVVTVNGVETTYASEGQIVKITPTAAYNYEYSDSLFYKSVDGSNTTAIADRQFVMPAYDVTISVSFRSAEAHTIYSATPSNGSYVIKNNGTVVNKAKAGQVIDIVPTAKDGYELGKIEVVPYNNSVKETVALNGNSFVMPEFDVLVNVVFKAEDFNIKSAATSNGTFTVVDGYDKVIASADTGAGIYVKPEPAAGYVIDKVTYTDYSGKVVEVGKTGDLYYFGMPASDVTVNVTFKARVFYLKADAASPAITFTVGGKEVTTAKVGETVTINGNPAEGVRVKKVEAYYTSSPTRSIPMTTENTLVMPATNVTFKVTYELIEYSLTATYSSAVSFKLNDANGKDITTARMGDTVYVVSKPDAGFHTIGIEAYDAKGNKVEVNLGAQTFKMPASDVKVSADYAKNS